MWKRTATEKSMSEVGWGGRREVGGGGGLLGWGGGGGSSGESLLLEDSLLNLPETCATFLDHMGQVHNKTWQQLNQLSVDSCFGHKNNPLGPRSS